MTNTRVQQLMARYGFMPRAFWVCPTCGQDVPEDPQHIFRLVAHAKEDGTSCPQRLAPESP